MRNWGEEIITLEETCSTNDYVKSLGIGGAADGAAAAAYAQTAGRGRGGRKWDSPPGGIYFSVLCRENPDKLSALPLVAAVAARRAIHGAVTLKWPNDLLVYGKKIAGILTETDLANNFTVIGIGVNVNNKVFLGGYTATSLANETGRKHDRLGIARSVIKELGRCVDIFAEEGFAPFREEYSRHCVTIGKTVAAGEISGIATRINNGGELIISTDTGPAAVSSGEVFHS
jgi:BirA family biotin operon repressor/biotin-[acetyl-CoA-carboxylase] ligase